MANLPNDSQKSEFLAHFTDKLKQRELLCSELGKRRALRVKIQQRLIELEHFFPEAEEVWERRTQDAQLCDDEKRIAADIRKCDKAIQKCKQIAPLEGVSLEEVDALLGAHNERVRATAAAVEASAESAAPGIIENTQADAAGTAQQSQSKHECFIHDSNYRSIRFADKNYSLTPNSANIVQKLHAAYERGLPNVSKAALLDSDNARLQDQFRGANQQLLGTLIVKTPGRRDMYRLNIPCPVCTGLPPGPKDSL